MIGARREAFTWPRRVLAWALAHDLTAFVVPDERSARAVGLDLEAAGLRPTATPRHATVLVLVGPIPTVLTTAVGVVYSQMPRPRAILAAGVPSLPGLPMPDVVTPLDQDAFLAGVMQLRGGLAAGAFAPVVAELQIAAVRTRTEYVCPMHPDIVRDEPGTCSLCGMDLVAREIAGAMTGHTPDHAGTPTHDEATVSAHPEHVEHPAAVYTCPMHPRIAEQEPGRCPVCGMNLVLATASQYSPDSQNETAPTPEHGAHELAPAAHENPSGQQVRHSEHGMAAVDTAVNAHDMNPSATVHAAMDHGFDTESATTHVEMHHDTMDHSSHGDDFMSMVAITRDLPRSADGLPMEWSDVPFGPLFPGLPGGLDVRVTLDGDGVVRAAATGATARGLEGAWTGPIEAFPDRLACVDPLVPVAYRLLARSALEGLAGLQLNASVARARIRDAEWERVGSHLGWLAEFTALIGERWLAQRAAVLQIAVARTADKAPAKLTKKIREFVALVARMPLIDRRLVGIGRTGTADWDRMRGPVARAAGIDNDARTGDAAYQALGFIPVIRAGGEALARLQVRLAEIAASLDLVGAVARNHHDVAHDAPLPSDLSGTASAAIETPQGAAWLQIVVDRGAVVAAHLDSPSALHISLVPEITSGEEVADALVAVASLDLSPWTVNP